MRNIYIGSLEDQLTTSTAEPEEFLKTKTDLQVGSSTAPQFTPPQPPPQQQKTAASEEFDRRALAKTLQIPTDDTLVRRLLISLNQPITLFGEGPGERRDRLRLMASKAICSLPRAFDLFPVLRTLCGNMKDTKEDFKEMQGGNDSENEEFYVPGSIDLIKIRSFLLEDSVHRSQVRQAQPPLNFTREHIHRTTLYANIETEMDLRGTRVDPNGRPLSGCTFSGNGDLYTGDWSGRVIKYAPDNSTPDIVSNTGDRITAMSSNINDEMVMFGTATGKIHFGSRVLTLPTTHAIKSLNWHPSGRFFASSSADSLWRLWDAQEIEEAVQVQEGHLGGISSGAWHPDGALYATGGTVDGLIRLWDCRLGKSLWTISQPPNVAISALTFSPLTPHLLASADSDGLIHFHDLRKLEAAYLKTAAHRSACSALKFTAGARILVSSGFDGCVRLWCPGDLSLIKELPISATKVTALDTLETGNTIKIAATTFDRSVKIFSN